MDAEQYEGMAGELQRRLRMLIAEDPNLSTFGANSYGSGHRFQLGITLSEEELVQFETANGVTLPGEYRAFLKVVGNGGAGPGYGLKPLDVLKKRPRLSTSFAFTQPFGFAGEGIPRDDEGEPTFRDGILYLAHHGCGIQSFLVVTGPCRGQVWIDDTCNDAGVFPEAGSFYFWYNAWINEALMNLFAADLGKNVT